LLQKLIILGQLSANDGERGGFKPLSQSAATPKASVLCQGNLLYTQQHTATRTRVI